MSSVERLEATGTYTYDDNGNMTKRVERPVENEVVASLLRMALSSFSGSRRP